MEGPSKDILMQSFKVIMCSLLRQSVLTCLIVLNPRSKSTLVAGMDKMISNTDKIKGHVECKAVLISCQVKVLCRTSVEYLPMCILYGLFMSAISYASNWIMFI